MATIPGGVFDQSSATFAETDVVDGFLVLNGLGEPDFETTRADATLAGGDRNLVAQGNGAVKLTGNAEENFLVGNSADNTIAGGEADDTVMAGQGDDSVDGGNGNDLILGWDGDDQIAGGDGADTIWGNQGADTIDGGDGDDLIYAGRGDDSVMGGAGNDTLMGDRDDDLFYGGDGDDVMHAGGGDDTMAGGAGADEFVFDDASGEDIILDFAEEDRLVFQSRINGQDIDSFEDIVARAVATADGLVIDLGEGNTLTLVGLSLADFQANASRIVSIVDLTGDGDD